MKRYLKLIFFVFISTQTYLGFANTVEVVVQDLSGFGVEYACLRLQSLHEEEPLKKVF